MRMEKLGVPTYDELVFVARRKDLDEEGASQLRRFLQRRRARATALRSDPDVGVDALLKADPGSTAGSSAPS